MCIPQTKPNFVTIRRPSSAGRLVSFPANPSIVSAPEICSSEAACKRRPSSISIRTAISSKTRFDLLSLQIGSPILLPGRFIQLLRAPDESAPALASPRSGLLLGSAIIQPTRSPASKAPRPLIRADCATSSSIPIASCASRTADAIRCSSVECISSTAAYRSPAVATSPVWSASSKAPSHSAAHALLHRHALVASLFKKLAQQRHRPYRSIQVLIRPCLISANTNQIFRPCVRAAASAPSRPEALCSGTVTAGIKRLKESSQHLPAGTILRRHRPRQHHVPIQQRPHRIHHRILLIVSLHQHRVEGRDASHSESSRPLHQLRQPARTPTAYILCSPEAPRLASPISRAAIAYLVNESSTSKTCFLARHKTPRPR